MKTQLLRSTLALALIAGLASAAPVAAKEPQHKAPARISEKAAGKIALSQFHNGKIRSADLQKERGKFVWTFAIAKPNSSKLSHVRVDAKSGAILSAKNVSQTERMGRAEKDFFRPGANAEVIISEKAARRAALAEVPKGKFKNASFQRDHGKSIWAVNVAKPNSAKITRVRVDANSGRIISARMESQPTRRHHK